MEQIPMDQYEFDKTRFSELLSKFTGISKTKIYEFISDNKASSIFEHPSALNISTSQLDKLENLRELRNIYSTLRTHDKEYIINSSAKAGEYFTEYLSGIKDKERFICSFLDSSNRIIATKTLSIGTVNEAPVYPREVAKAALMYDARSVILSHNHPGGNPSPSSADLEITGRVVEALGILNIHVMDHIIVANDKFTSFLEKGYSLEPASKANETAHKYDVAENTSKYNNLSVEINANEKCIKYIKGVAFDAGKLIKLSSKGEFVCNVQVKESDIFKVLHHVYKEGASINFNNLLDSTRFSYYKEMRSVYLLGDKTLNAIMEINKTAGRRLSLKDIKAMYLQAGRDLDNNIPGTNSVFSKLENIMDDVKQAKREYRNINASLDNVKSQSLILEKE